MAVSNQEMIRRYKKFEFQEVYMEYTPGSKPNTILAVKIKTDKGSEYFSQQELFDRIENDGLELPVKMYNGRAWFSDKVNKKCISGLKESFYDQGLLTCAFKYDSKGNRTDKLIYKELEKHISKSVIVKCRKEANKK